MKKGYICTEIRILSNLIRRKTFDTDCFNEIGVILGSQGYIIKFLSENLNSDIFQKDIEKKFKLRRSTVTSALNRMEKAEFIKRESVDFDSRLKKITLTEKGLSVHRYIEGRINEIEKDLEKSLNKEEIEQFFSIIKKLQAVVE